MLLFSLACLAPHHIYFDPHSQDGWHGRAGVARAVGGHTTADAAAMKLLLVPYPNASVPRGAVCHSYLCFKKTQPGQKPFAVFDRTRCHTNLCGACYERVRTPVVLAQHHHRRRRRCGWAPRFLLLRRRSGTRDRAGR